MRAAPWCRVWRPCVIAVDAQILRDTLIAITVAPPQVEAQAAKAAHRAGRGFPTRSPLGGADTVLAAGTVGDAAHHVGVAASERA
jgi:hypothetical protein